MQWLEELWTSVEAILWYVMVGHVMKWFYIKFFEIVMFFFSHEFSLHTDYDLNI